MIINTLRLLQIFEGYNTEITTNNNSKTDLNLSQNTDDTNYKISKKPQSENRTDKTLIRTEASTSTQKQDVAKQRDKIEIDSDNTKSSTSKRKLIQNDDILLLR